LTACRRLAVVCLLGCLSPVRAGPPQASDPRLVIELVSREPDIVTPTGLAVDERGRVWVIENHTHERPAAYKGPAGDRVRVFEDYDPAGKPRRAHTFAGGFRNAMSLTLGPDGEVFLATRSEVYRLRDSSGKGECDGRDVIVRLDTPGNYPHNGLSGFAWDALGNLYFALGENLGAAYKLIGSDGTTLRGGGEGGSIYRCRPDGTGLVRVATGFWNTFGLGVDAFGRLFAVDNDPDSRGPCRLLHIIPGGDYGYRYRNGRKGLHPFTAWDGELPGTLPMVAGTGEAPCAVVPYEAGGLPGDYRGDLLVTSWGDHTIERFRLEAAGASLRARGRAVVRGGEDFRPVAMAAGPDGSLYISDWVDRSYPVHGKGRIWRLRSKRPPADDGLRPSAVASLSLERQNRLLHDARQPIRQAAAEALAARGLAGQAHLIETLAKDEDTRVRLQALWALARTSSQPQTAALAETLLDTPAAEVRAEAARLLGEGLPELRTRHDEAPLLRLALRDPSAPVRLQAVRGLRTRQSLTDVLPLLADADPFLAAAALEVLGRPDNSILLLPHAGATDARLRVGVLLALRRGGDAAGRKALLQFLDDPDPGVRRAAIQWVAEERLREFVPRLDASASRPPVTRELVEALLAARQVLSGAGAGALDEAGAQDQVARVVTDACQPAAFRVVALRMLRADHPALKAELLGQLLEKGEPDLRRGAVGALALREDGPSQGLLRRLAGDRAVSLEWRRDAVMGLAHSAASSPATRERLLGLLDEPMLRCDALRSLRASRDDALVPAAVLRCWDGAGRDAPDRAELAAQALLLLPPAVEPQRRRDLLAVAAPRPAGEAQWRAAVAAGGDATAGARVFYHPQGPRCFACHRVDGRGAAIGPDLSAVGRSLTRDRLVESILAPSKEVAPRFVSWRLSLRDGRERVGMIVDEGPNSTVSLADNRGHLETIARNDIEERQALATSIMPEGLVDLMTVQEFRDLVAFLEARR
jgi:putative membrane-bound dehydrogenase-like protein